MLLSKKRKFDLESLNGKLERKNVYKNFFLFMMGMAISAISVSVFFKPNNIVTGGSTGLAILITNYIDIDLSLVIFVISSIMLVLSFGVFGIEYGSKNIVGTILYPVFVKAATLINNVVDFDGTSLFLLVIVGGILSGIGTGLIKKSGYSSGGFLVLYDIINTKMKVSVGKASMVVNSLIMIASLFIYGPSACIYGLIGLYISTYMTDKVMIGISNNKAFYVITKKPLEVKDYIINNLNHTVTIVSARGGYSNKKKKMLICVIPTMEYTRVKEVIKEIDKEAFFLITDSYYVSK